MSDTTWFHGFEPITLQTPDSTVFARVGGRPGAPALMLVHGFPQTSAMWQRVAQRLKNDFFLILPDLRGYGASLVHPETQVAAGTTGPAPGEPRHLRHSKRAMAHDLALLLDHLGVEQAGVCGHDRGGRAAHRFALDHPGRTAKLCVIDIAPTLDMYQRTDMAFARAYYHWFHLIQPAPLPETMVGGNPLAYLHAKLGGWGSGGLSHIEPEALAEYEHSFCRPEAIHSACEDYRASAGIDLEHDQESRAQEQRIEADTLVLWGERGVVQKMFDPLRLWQAQCGASVVGWAMPAGHFIPEELPEETAAALKAFFA
jgi:haloacetate dehalogenase